MRALSRVLVPAVLALVAAAVPSEMIRAAEEIDGKALYGRKCAMCHGSNGVAKEFGAKLGAKNFTDAAWQKTTTDAQITKAIADGVPEKKMPSYKDSLKPEEIAALVKHIRSFAPAK